MQDGIQLHQGLDIWLQTTFDITDFTTANVQNNQMYNPMKSSSLSTETFFMIGEKFYW
jgi:hypothetical protein